MIVHKNDSTILLMKEENLRIETVNLRREIQVNEEIKRKMREEASVQDSFAKLGAPISLITGNSISVCHSKYPFSCHVLCFGFCYF